MKAALFIHTLMITGLVACGGGSGGGDGDNSTPGVSAFEGVWTSTANGESYAISNNEVKLYQHTSRHCIQAEQYSGLDRSELQAVFALSNNDQALAIRGSDGTAELHAPVVTYEKSDALPTACSQPIAKKGERGYQRNVARDLDIFGQTFSDYYLSFDVKQVDWPARYDAAKAQVGANTSDADFFEILYQLTLPLADAHVQVSDENLGSFSADGKPTLVARLIKEYVEANGDFDSSSPNDIDSLNQYIGDQLALRESLLFSYADDDSIREAANGEIRWYSVDNIAYLYIGAMTGFGDAEDPNEQLQALDTALDRVLADIQSAEGLIIDVRANNGGQDFLSMAIASRFVSTETLAFSKQSRQGNYRTQLEEVFISPRGNNQYLGPIVLLTSNSTVSAAEVFTLMMRSLPNVTLVGESTQGALSDSLEKVLPNGFAFTLSNQFYYSPAGEWFEHVGIPVDIETPFFSAQERAAGVDIGLETAYTFLINGG